MARVFFDLHTSTPRDVTQSWFSLAVETSARSHRGGDVNGPRIRMSELSPPETVRLSREEGTTVSFFTFSLIAVRVDFFFLY